jgi:hypothetical protein
MASWADQTAKAEAAFGRYWGIAEDEDYEQADCGEQHYD